MLPLQMLSLLQDLNQINDGLNPVMKTACTGAGMRVSECELILQPLINDPIAKV